MPLKTTINRNFSEFTEKKSPLEPLSTCFENKTLRLFSSLQGFQFCVKTLRLFFDFKLLVFCKKLSDFFSTLSFLFFVKIYQTFFLKLESFKLKIFFGLFYWKWKASKWKNSLRFFSEILNSRTGKILWTFFLSSLSFYFRFKSWKNHFQKACLKPTKVLYFSLF